jgi:hypothetical protein
MQGEIIVEYVFTLYFEPDENGRRLSIYDSNKPFNTTSILN